MRRHVYCRKLPNQTLIKKAVEAKANEIEMKERCVEFVKRQVIISLPRESPTRLLGRSRTILPREKVVNEKFHIKIK